MKSTLFRKMLRDKLMLLFASTILALAASSAPALTNCCPDNGDIKYVQNPNLTNGVDWDVSSSSPFPYAWVVADDFLCTNSGPVIGIHLWGSWLNDWVDNNAVFILAIWSDVPTNNSTFGFSHPGTNLWSQTYTHGQYSSCSPAYVPEDFTAGYQPVFGRSSNLFHLCFNVNPANTFTQSGTFFNKTNYWLSVSVQTTNSQFGWKSSPDAYNDMAVGFWGPTLWPQPTDWNPLSDPFGTPLNVNLAFKIITVTNTPPTNPPPCCPDNGGLKYIQHPNLANGFDMDASFFPPDADGLQWILADDFTCTNQGPITDIHLWGSWLNNQRDPNAVYTLAIWSDVPTNGQNSFSHPGTNLWSQTYSNNQYTLCHITNRFEYFAEGYGDQLGSSTDLLYLCFDVDQVHHPISQNGTLAAPTNYWLSVTVMSTNLFGWKSSWENRNDYAVGAAYFGGVPYPPVPQPSQWFPVVDTNYNMLNLAFKITTSTNPCPLIVDCPTPVKTNDCQSWFFDDVHASNICCGPITNITYFYSTNSSPTSPCPLIITRVALITDCLTNQASCTQTVVIVDMTGPIFTNCPTNFTVECGTPWDFGPDPGAKDACSGADLYVYTLQNITNHPACPLVVTRTWAAVNSCGKSNFCCQTVTNVDTTAPVFTNCPADFTVECATPWGFGPNPVAVDTCCGTNVSVVVVSTITNNAGAPCTVLVTRLWQAADLCSNASFCQQKVTVRDTTPPVIYCPSNVVVYTCLPSIAVTWSATATDACDNATVHCTPPSGTVFTQDTTNTIQVVATDDCGNSSTTNFLVTVLRPPVAISIGAGGTVIIRWPDGGILQQRDDLVLGAWADVVPPAVSPYTTPANVPRRFYRIRCP